MTREPIDLSRSAAEARRAAEAWGLTLGDPFALSYASYVAPVGEDAVLKAPYHGDVESLHEGEALELWDGDGAVRLLRREGRVLLEERAVPGTDISELREEDATAIAVAVGTRLWRPAGEPFRRVADEVPGWLEHDPGLLTELAWELWQSFEPRHDWLVHGDFHHHNILRHGAGYVVIDPKPYLAEREYDVYTWLHNPIGYVMNRETTERRIAAFVAAGLDEERIRIWAVVRGAYLGGLGVEGEILRGLI